MISSYHFLTTKPLKRTLLEEQQEYLYILALAAIANAELDITIYYDDATNHNYTHALDSLVKGQIYIQNISFASLDYKQYQPAKTITHIEIKIDSDSEKLTLIPETIKSDHVREFHYFNSLGGMDSLVSSGDQQYNLETDYEETLTELDDSATLKDAEYVVHNTKARNPFTVFTGFKLTSEIDATKDMFLVNNAYELIENTGYRALIPVILDQKRVTYPSVNNNKKALSFKARPAYDELALDRIE